MHTLHDKHTLLQCNRVDQKSIVVSPIGGDCVLRYCNCVLTKTHKMLLQPRMALKTVSQ
jgi:hypothetical protein